MGGGGLNEGCPIKYRMPNLRDRYKKMFTVYLKFKFYPVDLHLFIFFFSLFLLLSLATLLERSIGSGVRGVHSLPFKSIRPVLTGDPSAH